MVDYPHPLASVQHRLGGKAVDAAMYTVTLGIGWFIWSLVVWGQGQTPGKQIVKLRVYDKTTGLPVKWGHMALREFVLPFSLSIIAWIFLAIASVGGALSEHPLYMLVVYAPIFILWVLDAFYIFAGGKKNRLVDVISKTDVLNESV